MTAPSYVPVDPTHQPRDYESPVRRPDSWWADRPAEMIGERQPRSGLFGNQGPDIGYALKLVRLFDGKLHLSEGVNQADAEAGAVAVAMKRASLFGRAPVIHDLRIAFTIWGFLDPQAPSDLVEIRREMFEEAGALHGYPLRRRIADAVSDEVLSGTPNKIISDYRSDWRSVLSV